MGSKKREYIQDFIQKSEENKHLNDLDVDDRIISLNEKG